MPDEVRRGVFFVRIVKDVANAARNERSKT